jgi:transmembrane sensor
MIDASVRDQAALWMARARDPRFSDWDALTDWLEADPAHNLAYEAAFAGHDLADILSTAPAPPEVVVVPAASRWRKRGFIGGGLIGTAAAAAAVFALVGPLGVQTAEMVAETAPGQHRLIHLQDGTEIALNGDTRLVLDASNGRTARLERGEAMFNVVHDETRPFTVDANGTRIVDIGTRFDVVQSARGSEVAVAEGAVLYDPNGAAVRLGTGRLLRRAEGSPIVEVSQTDPANVGAWRSGHLVYRDAPLWRVADDLSRTTGSRIMVEPRIANRPFTGAIVITAADRHGALLQRLGAVLDVTVARQPNGLYLKARTPH